MKPVRITAAAQVARSHDARGAIVILFDHLGYSATSWGATRADCSSLAGVLDQIADGLQSGKLGPVWDPPAAGRGGPAREV